MFACVCVRAVLGVYWLEHWACGERHTFQIVPVWNGTIHWFRGRCDTLVSAVAVKWPLTSTARGNVSNREPSGDVSGKDFVSSTAWLLGETAGGEPGQGLKVS